MGLLDLFMTTTSRDAPLDASSGNTDKPTVSDFLTVQTLANFAAMTGAITAAWGALQTLIPGASAIWVPYVFAFSWAGVSFLISWEGLKKTTTGKREIGTVAGAIFVAAINALVLGGAVVGTNVATS